MRLFQLCCVYQWTNTEMQRLLHILFNQKDLRAEIYCGIIDTTASDRNPSVTNREVCVLLVLLVDLNEKLEVCYCSDLT